MSANNVQQAAQPEARRGQAVGDVYWTDKNRRGNWLPAVSWSS